jgi:hypothetical protein
MCGCGYTRVNGVRWPFQNFETSSGAPALSATAKFCLFQKKSIKSKTLENSLFFFYFEDSKEQ